MSRREDGQREGQSQWPQIAVLVAALLWCAIPLSPAMTDGDFWGHVQYGRDTLHHGLDRTATYTYTAAGYRWINHEILSEVVFAWVCDHANSGTLLGIKCLLGLSVLAVAALRKSVHPLLMIGVWVLTSLNLSFYWATRPQIFSFTFFAWMICIVDLSFRGWSDRMTWRAIWSREAASECWPERSVDASHPGRLRWLWLVPPLMLVWTNTHGGFLAGLGVFGLIMAGRIWQARRAPWEIRRQLGLVLIATFAATLLTPYGWQLHYWLIHSVSNPRPEVIEWRAPQWFEPGAIKLWGLAAAMIVGLALSTRRRDAVQLLVLPIVAWQAIEHQRHIPFVAILFAAWLPEHLQSACQRLAPRIGAVSAEPLRAAVAVHWQRLVGGSAVVLGLALAVTIHHRIATLRVDCQVFPVAALSYIARQDLQGRCLVTAQWAQYLLATLGTRDRHEGGLEVAFDGRYDTCYPQPIIDMYFDFDRGPGGPDQRWRGPDSPACDPHLALSAGDPELVFVARRNQHIQAIMREHPDEWSVLYQDQTAQLWGRSDLYDDPTSAKYLAVERRVVTSERQRSWVAWPAAPVME